MMPWLAQYLQFLQEYRFIVFGPILILLVIFVPHGIVGSFLAWRVRRAAAQRAPAASVGGDRHA
jgi:branched-chain amino acid transport system permease protein